MSDPMDEIHPVEQAVNKELGITADATPRTQPVYKVYKDTKIPVAKSAGKLWRSRRDAAKKSVEPYEESWREATRYYNNDQLSHRDNNDAQASGNTVNSRRMNNRFSQTENIVFANTTAMIPALYAKNPNASMLTRNAKVQPLFKVVERIVDILANKKAAPGFNLKTKGKRAVLMTTLTNCTWFYVGYVKKENSSEQALADIQRIGSQLQDAKTQQVIEDLEGQLYALEETIDLWNPAGPWVKIRSGTEVLVDPDAEEPDFSDARWMMVQEMIPTTYLNAKYGERDDKTGRVKSIYEPTHILRNTESQNDPESDVNNFSLYEKTNKEMKTYGYDDQDCFDKAKRTLTWMVWDRTTQRVLMYSDDYWDYPIWVWDDPLKLDTFFPLTPMMFHLNPDGTYAKGEVSYYLDQQDAINEINDEQRRARQWARRNVLFDISGLSKDDVEAYLKGDDGTARGVKVPDGKKLSDMIGSAPVPSVQFAQLFDKGPIFDAIDRIASVNDIMRGAEFKTNTTNKAIENYNSANNMRLDEKIDAIEDALSSVIWMISQMILQFMPPADVVDLLGPEEAEGFVNMQWDEIRRSCGSVRIVAGSTTKPTSAARKQEAIQLAQVLGQFANGAPVTVTKITLDMLSKAFDEVDVTTEDWQRIEQEAVASMQKGVSTPGQAPPQQGAPQQEQAPQQGQPPAPQLPPQAQQAVQAAIQRGVPPQEALQAVMQELQQQQPPAGQPTAQ